MSKLEDKRKEIAKKLNERQKKFCDGLLLYNYNATEAAKHAGYSEKNAAVQGSRLLRNDNVAAYTRILQEIAVEQSGLNPDFVVLKLLEILDLSMQQKPVKVWDYERHCYVDGITSDFDKKSALRALEMLGKTQGMFGAKLDVKAENNEIRIVIAGGSEELAK